MADRSPEKLRSEYQNWQTTQKAERKKQLLQRKRAERKQRARQRSAAVSLRQQQMEQEASDVAQRKAARAAADAAAAAAAAAAVAIVQVSAAALEVEVALRTRAAQAAIAAHAHVQGRAPTGQSGAAQAKARADAAAAAAAAYGDPRARPLPSWTERTHDEHALVVQCAARRNIAVRVAQQERARLAEALRKEVMLELKEERERSAIRLQAAVRGRFARAEQERRRAAEEAELDAEIRREIKQEGFAATQIQRVGRGYIGRRIAAYLLEIEEVELRRQLEAERSAKAEADDSGGSASAGAGVKQSVWAYRYGSTPARDLSGVLPRMDGETSAVHVNPTALLAHVRKTGRVRVLAVTWNLHGQPPPEDLTTLLPRGKFHIYAIGTEECERSIAVSLIFQRKKAWEAKLRSTLGPDYSMLMSHTLQAIHMIVYVHSALVPLIDNIESSAVATGIGNALGNKGGIGISFRLGNTSILFLNCHLASGQREVEARNEDALKVNTELDLPHVDTGDIKETAELSTDRFDRVVWMGDMNYRVALERDEVDELLARNKLQDMLKADQLALAMSSKVKAFKGMVEGPVKFPPTYKFNPGQLVYDTSSKKRVPSWTDRVLYKDDGIDFLAYNCCHHYKSSDHLPVYCLFNVHFSHNTKSPLKDAEEVQTGKSKSQVCSIM
eukprot:g2038.t1